MWRWLEGIRKFIRTATNKLLGKRELASIQLSAIDIGIDVVNNITQQLIDNQITIAQWERQVREQIKNTYVQQYLLGIGGTEQLINRDFGSIGGMLAEQYRFLSRFAEDIAAGELSPAQIFQRIHMYIRSSQEAFNRGSARTWGVPISKLPAIPADGKEGTCLGLTNCGCRWEFEEVLVDGKLTGWNCTWKLGTTEHCELCLGHAATWNPLFIERE